MGGPVPASIKGYGPKFQFPSLGLRHFPSCRGLGNSVQGRRCFNPSDEDLSLGTPGLRVASTCKWRLRDTVTQEMRSTPCPPPFVSLRLGPVLSALVLVEFEVLGLVREHFFGLVG